MESEPWTIVVAAIACIVSALSYINSRRVERTNIRPTLVFVFDGAAGWRLENIGSGPAVNILVAEGNSRSIPDSPNWESPVRVPPLGQKGAHALHWNRFTNADQLGATYSDILGRQYTTKCDRDENKLDKGNALPKWSENQIVASWKLPVSDRTS